MVVPSVSVAEQEQDDARMEDEVARCRVAATRQAEVIAPEDTPFLGQPVVAEGPFKGCVLDISRFRPVTRVVDVSVLPASAANVAESSNGSIVVANFQHTDTFWFALIDPTAVDRVLVQMEHTGSLNHGQVRITFQPGREAIRLFPQGPPDGRAPTSLDDITFTADGIAPVGVDRPAGLLPPRQYPMVYRAMSTADKIRIMTESDGSVHVVEQFLVLSNSNPSRLNMAARFIDEWVERGSRAQYETMFQLLPLPPGGSLNCTSALFQVLDNTVEYPDAGWRARVLDEFLPLRIPTYLAWRGYHIDEIRQADLDAELGLPGPPGER